MNDISLQKENVLNQSFWTMSNSMMDNIVASLKNLYHYNNLCCEFIVPEKEHAAYGSYCFTLNKKTVKLAVSQLA